MADFTALIPGTVIGRISGVATSREAEERFHALARDCIRGMGPAVPGNVRARAASALDEICSDLEALTEERRRDSREDLISEPTPRS